MFHFGKGRGEAYCAGCKASGAPCATKNPGECTYNAQAPRGRAGQLAWAYFKENFWRAKVAGMGAVIGIESAPALAGLVRAGVPEDEAEDLLAACEMGFIAAMNERDDEGQH